MEVRVQLKTKRNLCYTALRFVGLTESTHWKPALRLAFDVALIDNLRAETDEGHEP